MNHDYFNETTENLSGCVRCGAPIELSEQGFGFTVVNGETAIFILVTVDGARITALENNPFITDTDSPRLMGMPVMAHIDMPWGDLYSAMVQSQAAMN